MVVKGSRNVVLKDPTSLKDKVISNINLGKRSFQSM